MISPVVNARFLTQPVTGVQRHAIEISKRLRKLDPAIRFLAPRGMVHEELFAELKAERVGRLTGHGWEQLELSRHSGPAPLIGLCNAGPLYRQRQLITLHDAAPFAVPEAYSRSFRYWYKFASRALGQSAGIVATDSEFSRHELTERTGVPSEKIEVILLGHEHVFDNESDSSIIQRHKLDDRPYLFAVGSRSPHKNFRALIGALNWVGDVGFRIVIAGGVSPKVHAEARVDESMPKNVCHVGFVTDGQLRALYEHASAYVHPAYYEGFGLPPLEAMALGCPVICSRAASLPEVCGNAAVYFDPHDERALAEAILRTMKDGRLRHRLSQEGKMHAENFRWDHSAQRILQLAYKLADY